MVLHGSPADPAEFKALPVEPAPKCPARASSHTWSAIAPAVGISPVAAGAAGRLSVLALIAAMFPPDSRATAPEERLSRYPARRAVSLASRLSTSAGIFTGPNSSRYPARAAVRRPSRSSTRADMETSVWVDQPLPLMAVKVASKPTAPALRLSR